MATVQSFFGDVQVIIEYEMSGDTPEIESVNVGEIDISSGLSTEQLANFESVCYWHDSKTFKDAEAEYYDFHRRAA